jgi:Effector Associated Constant Component 1
MADPTLVQFTFGLAAPDLEDAERLKFARQLLPELRQVDAVERADRTEAIAEAGEKGFKELVGWLTADVSVKNITGFLGWMGSRLADRPVKVKVKLGDREVELESDQLNDPEATALRLIAALQGAPGA